MKKELWLVELTSTGRSVSIATSARRRAPRDRQSGHRIASQCALAVPESARPGGGAQAIPGSGQRP
eukprot:3588402-Prorocentrum_lima.AAC.1